MIRYARRKKKRDLFVLWLGLSTMCFGVGGATLRGVKAVSVAPVLYDPQPQHIEVSLVSIPDGIGGGNEIDATGGPPEAPGPAPGGETASPFDTAPLDLPLPGPVVGDGIGDAGEEPGAAAAETPEETTAPETDPVPEPAGEAPLEPAPEPAADTPPEPAPEVAPVPADGGDAVEPAPEAEAKPPAPRTAPTSRPKPKATPPKPAPKATPASRDPKVAVTRPKILYRPNLRFPEQAQRAGIGGSLLLEVRVGTDGRPARIRVLRSSGHRILDNEAISALRQWRFEPARNAFGKPVANTIQVPVNFGYAR